jgi:cell division protein FtsB
LKRVAQAHSASSSSVRAYALTASKAGTEIRQLVPHVPNYVWLTMIILAALALSVTSYLRAQEMEREAKLAHAFVETRVEDARALNAQLKKQNQKLKQNPRVAERAAQEQLRVLRRNEVVVALPERR